MIEKNGTKLDAKETSGNSSGCIEKNGTELYTKEVSGNRSGCIERKGTELDAKKASGNGTGYEIKLWLLRIVDGIAFDQYNSILLSTKTNRKKSGPFDTKNCFTWDSC